MAKMYGLPEDDQPDVEGPLTLQDVRLIVKTLLRNPTMLQGAVAAGFAATQFNGYGEYPYSVVVQAAIGLVNLHNAATQEMIETELAAWQAAGVISFTESDAAEIFGNEETLGFIPAVFAPDTRDAKQVLAEKEYAGNLLNKFLKARYITKSLSDVLSGVPRDSSPLDMEKLLEQFYRRSQSIKYVGTEIEEEAFMPAFGEEITYDAVVPVPTGLPWIDTFIGGFAPGEIIGLLGPTGGGKSNMMICAAVRMAQYYAAHNMKKLSVYVCYEDGNYRMKPLFWSAATHIPRERFTEGGRLDWSRLSTSEMPNDFDRRLPENQNGEFILGERERYIAAQSWMTSNFRFLDFSYNIATGGRGSGGVAEIVAVVERLCEKAGMELGFICIDYAGLLVERHMAATGRISGGGVDNVWLPLKTLGDVLRSHLAAPTGATVVLAHQIAGDAAGKKPFHKYLHHFDVQGCKAFAENTHSCLCVNSGDPDTGARLINFSKIRYGAPENSRGIVMIKREYCAVELVTDHYHVDEFSKKIVPKNEMSSGSSAGAGHRDPPSRRLIPGDNFSHNIL
jgi:hypothetical protein